MLAIITGTLYPAEGMYQVDLSDVEERLKQYAAALQFISESKKIRRCVFCENSGHIGLMERLKEMAGDKKPIEYLTFTGTYDAVQYGKGYGEGEILKYVWGNSRFLREEKEFVKITGRIIIRNIDSIIDKMKPDVNYFNSVRVWTRDAQIDTKFYKVTKEAFEQNFLDAYKNVSDREGRYLEHVYYTAIKKNKLRYRNFPEYPIYEGSSGSLGVSYGSVRWKYILKNILSKLNLYKNI